MAAVIQSWVWSKVHAALCWEDPKVHAVFDVCVAYSLQWQYPLESHCNNAFWTKSLNFIGVVFIFCLKPSLYFTILFTFSTLTHYCFSAHGASQTRPKPVLISAFLPWSRGCDGTNTSAFLILTADDGGMNQNWEGIAFSVMWNCKLAENFSKPIFQLIFHLYRLWGGMLVSRRLLRFVYSKSFLKSQGGTTVCY